jgi:hypothetical protein
VAEPNTAALIPQLRWLGMGTADLHRVFATFNVAAPGFERARAQAAAKSPPAKQTQRSPAKDERAAKDERGGPATGE